MSVNWKRVGAFFALLAGAAGFALWYVLRAQKEAKERADRAWDDHKFDARPWAEISEELSVKLQEETDQIAKAKADEVVKLFEAAFPRGTP